MVDAMSGNLLEVHYHLLRQSPTFHGLERKMLSFVRDAKVFSSRLGCAIVYIGMFSVAWESFEWMPLMMSPGIQLECESISFTAEP